MIAILPAPHTRVAALREAMRRQSPLALALLFGGDRWQHVAVCAVATAGGEDVGMASLAPCDEGGQGGPHIIGVWVHPAWRRQGIGTALLTALAEESRHSYHQTATAEAVTEPGWCCLQRLGADVPLHGTNKCVPGWEL